MLNPEDVFIRFVTDCELNGEPGALARVAKQLNVPRSTITRMAKRCRFSERYAGDVVPLVQAKTNELAATNAAEWRAEQARVGSELVRKGFEALERAQLMGTKEALDAIKLGAALCDRATEPNQKRASVEVDVILRERFERFVSVPAPAPSPRLLKVDFGDIDDEE